MWSYLIYLIGKIVGYRHPVRLSLVLEARLERHPALRRYARRIEFSDWIAVAAVVVAITLDEDRVSG